MTPRSVEWTFDHKGAFKYMQIFFAITSSPEVAVGADSPDHVNTKHNITHVRVY